MSDNAALVAELRQCAQASDKTDPHLGTYEADVMRRAAHALENIRPDWAWHTFDHPAIAKIKNNGTRILVWVPYKLVSQSNTSPKMQLKEPKLCLVHWSHPVDATKAVTPGKRSLALQEKHGGFWAMDKKGIKPLLGAPVLWCHLPDVSAVFQKHHTASTYCHDVCDNFNTAIPNAH